MTTSFEYAFQDPVDPLIVDPFEFGEQDQHALAIRIIPPALAATAAASMLQVRTAILKEAGAPKETLDRYDPATESTSQVGYITQSGHDVHYLSAVVGPSEHINKLAEKDAQGLPKYSGQSTIEIESDLEPDVRAYLQEQIKKRRETEYTVEQYLQTVGLAKLSRDEEGVRIEALDVHPDFARRSIGSLLLFKGFGVYGRHAGVQPRPEEPEVQFFGVDADDEWQPLLLQAKIPKFDTQLPAMLERLGMGHDGYEYVGELRAVQERLYERLAGQSLIEAPES